MTDRHRAHCVSLRHRVTPPHDSTPADVVVVDVDKRSVVVAVWVVDVVGSASSAESAMTFVATVSKITRNSSDDPSMAATT